MTTKPECPFCGSSHETYRMNEGCGPIHCLTCGRTGDSYASWGQYIAHTLTGHKPEMNP